MTEKWTRSGQIGKSTPLTVAGTHAIVRADGTAVAYVIDSDDAHKVKAAPDLYEALKRIAQRARDLANDSETANRGLWRACADDAEATLSRARGETP